MEPQDRDHSQTPPPDDAEERGSVVIPAALAKPVPLERRRKLANQPKPSVGIPQPMKIAILVAAGVLVLSIVTTMALRSHAKSQAEARAKAAAQSIEQLAHEAEERTQADKRAADERQRVAQEQERLRFEQLREQQRQVDNAQKSAASEAARKEKAWAAYYHRPPGCTDAQTMECVNHYIRAKKAFEERFAKGEL